MSFQKPYDAHLKIFSQVSDQMWVLNWLLDLFTLKHATTNDYNTFINLHTLQKNYS
jgi:hypothetical protein